MQLTGGLPQRFADEMGALLGPDFPKDIGLAVSGGGDSMAMLHLAAGWARTFGIQLWVATVDHGLRAESAEEAKLVAGECAGLGVPHSTLLWEGEKTGNLQDAARQARLDLINRWRGGVQHVLFAHTADDQAETFLMRLARGSGVDGLSGMRAVHRVEPIERSLVPIKTPQSPPLPSTRSNDWHVVRPLLDVSRAELRHYLDTLKIPYVDDPSNDNREFARVRMRQFLAEEGADLDRLLATQKAMARAQAALAQRAVDAAKEVRKPSPAAGILKFDRDAFAKIEEETQLRIMAGALQSVTGQAYRPRLDTLERSVKEAIDGRTATLHGAMILPRKWELFVGREYNAVKDVVVEAGPTSLWDRRWVCYGPEIKGFQVKALGSDGVRALKGECDTDIPYDLLLALPGIFDGDTLMACSSPPFGKRFIQQPRSYGKDFAQSFLTH